MNEKKGELHRILRFLLVGGSSTLLDYGIYGLLSMTINFNLAKLLSMVCSCVYSFFLNKSFTFQDKGKISPRHVIRYFISQLINIGINVAVNALVYGWTGKKLLGMLFATGSAMTVNFLLQRFMVFSVQEKIELRNGE